MDGDWINLSDVALSKGGTQIQRCIVFFKDNTYAVFSGPAILKPGETKDLFSIRFSEPEDLPPDCKFEDIKA